MKKYILPSLLAADIGRLAEETLRAQDSGSDALHLDIMDAGFVPNISFGPEVVRMATRVAPDYYRNVHLMLSRPDLFVDVFAAAGAQTIQIHVEASCDVRGTLEHIRELGVRAALAVNPETPLSAALPYLPFCDELLVMTVHPGYGGQKFIEDCLPKVSEARKIAPELDIMVDGGVNMETLRLADEAGANMFVAGSFLFRQSDMKAAVERMRAVLGGAF